MTISSTVTKIQYSGNSATTVFAYPFHIGASTEIKCIYTDLSNVETVLVLDTDYTVSGVDNENGGNVTLIGSYAVTPPVNGTLITLKRVITLTQEVDYEENTKFPADTNEKALDKLTKISQQLDEKISRSLLLAESTTVSDLTFPEPTAKKALKWNDNGDALINSTYDFDDIVTDSTTAANDAAASAASAATSATNAATSETNAAASANNASNSASAASTSATSASASATTATNQATASSTSASNAATSATNAANSEAGALAIYGDTMAMNAAVTSATNSATSASNSATSATSSATSAATSASTATTQANNASTSASNAATSASSASTSATNAATSATNASNSAAAAAASAAALPNAVAIGAGKVPVSDGATWSGTSVGAGDLIGVNNLSDVTNVQTALKNIGGTPKSGFPIDASGNYYVTLAYNETTRTVTITPTGATFDVFVDGKKYTFTGAQTKVHTTTQGGHFIYVDNTGTITTSTTSWDLTQTAPIMYVFWDSTNSRGIPFYEWHHAGRDVYLHKRLHNVDGTQIVSGFSASGYTLNTDSDAGVTYAVASGVIADEDIFVTTESLADAGPYTIFWRSGGAGDWQFSKTSTLPFIYSGSTPQYNQYTGATWQMTNVTNTYFYNMWVFATTALPVADITPSPTGSQNIVLIPGQAIYSTVAAAQAETTASLSYGTLPFQEVAPLYEVTLEYKTSYAGTAKVQIKSVTRVVGSRANITAVATSGALLASNNLSDVTDAATARTNLGITSANPSLGTSGIIRTNASAINEDITFVAGGVYENGMTIGPVTINSGKTVTVASGCVWTIV